MNASDSPLQSAAMAGELNPVLMELIHRLAQLFQINEKDRAVCRDLDRRAPRAVVFRSRLLPYFSFEACFEVSWGACAWIASACTEPASSEASAVFIMR